MKARGSNGRGDNSAWPASILEKSRMSLTTHSRIWPPVAMFPRRSRMNAGHDHVVDPIRPEPSGLQGLGHRLLGQGDVGMLAETLLPQPGVIVARAAPPVEKLLGGDASAEGLEERRTVRCEQEGDGAVTATAFVGTAGEPRTDIGEDDEGR